MHPIFAHHRAMQYVVARLARRQFDRSDTKLHKSVACFIQRLALADLRTRYAKGCGCLFRGIQVVGNECSMDFFVPAEELLIRGGQISCCGGCGEAEKTQRSSGE